MKRFALILAIVAAIFATGCVSQPVAPKGADVKIAILHVNDTHGHPLAFANGNATEIGGLPAMAMLVGQTRAEFDNVLVLDAGDFNTGLSESNFFKAEPDIIGRNMIRLRRRHARQPRVRQRAVAYSRRRRRSPSSRCSPPTPRQRTEHTSPTLPTSSRRSRASRSASSA